MIPGNEEHTENHRMSHFGPADAPNKLCSETRIDAKQHQRLCGVPTCQQSLSSVLLILEPPACLAEIVQERQHG